MYLNDYQKAAMTFRVGTADETYALLNLPGEVGELLSLVAKRRRDGVQEGYFENVRKELGDILWMVAAIAEDHYIPLDEVASGNIEKLTSRQERGKLQGSGDER